MIDEYPPVHLLLRESFFHLFLAYYINHVYVFLCIPSFIMHVYLFTLTIFREVKFEFPFYNLVAILRVSLFK